MNKNIKKIGLVIAQQDFQDEEYFVTKSVLEKAGLAVSTISLKKGEALGIFGGVVDVDLAVSEVKTKDFDGLVFIGGSGMADQLNNKDFQKLAKESVEGGNILAAICIAPALLAKAGVLKNKKATVWSSPMDKHAVNILKEAGVDYKEEPLVIDENIITAAGPSQARKFGEAIAESLLK
ncbi:MAG: DJ-1/PfpI family protein [Candidatus Pacebacteria bacterium]|nr:DJ-1/PfpI family protein [Candidatus Paceibacterota bacterium]